MGVNHAYDDDRELGAGDQGIMFGYACSETNSFMPLAIHLANELTCRLTYLRKTGIFPFLRPDGKSRVTVEYRDGIPRRVEAAAVSAQHDPEISIERLRKIFRTC